MKHCVNCKNFDNDDSRPAPVCRKAKTENLVTGKDDYRACSDTRADESLCGYSASWFEPKPGAP